MNQLLMVGINKCIEIMNNSTPENNESTAQARLEQLVSAWNQSSFEAYSHNFSQDLVDHYNPHHFTHMRNQYGKWMSNQYLGSLKQGCHQVHLWRSRFESPPDDALFSLTLTADGKIAKLLTRYSHV
jgi:hypothetical protein